MSIAEQLITELEREADATRQLLSRVPSEFDGSVRSRSFHIVDR